MEQTKICKKCGKELPISQFGHLHTATDGLRSECRACFSKRLKEVWVRRKQKQQQCNATTTVAAPAISLNPHYKPKDMSQFTNRDLLEEIARRGFSGELKFTKVIDISNF